MSDPSEVLEQRCIKCGEKKAIHEFWSSWGKGNYVARKCADCRFGSARKACAACGNPIPQQFELCKRCWWLGEGTT